MPTHICERCGKEFTKKAGLTTHMKRKNPCKAPDALIQKEINKELVQEFDFLRSAQSIQKWQWYLPFAQG